jgi:hypothetical protein
LEAADALIDVPEINVARGGIRFTPGPSFADIFAGTGFSQTEAQAIAGTTKPCYRVPCPPFTEVRAGVEGVCITSGILQDRAFPELTARVVRGALIAHAHKISAKTIAKIIAGSTAVPTLVAQGGAAAPVLNAIELSVEDIKYKHRIARGATLEAVFPAWSLGLIRADLAFRLGVDNYLSIPDADDPRVVHRPAHRAAVRLRLAGHRDRGDGGGHRVAGEPVVPGVPVGDVGAGHGRRHQPGQRV